MRSKEKVILILYNINGGKSYITLYTCRSRIMIAGLPIATIVATADGGNPAGYHIIKLCYKKPNYYYTGTLLPVFFDRIESPDRVTGSSRSLINCTNRG